MPSVSINFRVHIPYQLRKNSPANMASCFGYFDAGCNRSVVEKMASECYVPANNILQNLVEKYKDRFRFAFSISGTAIELLQEYRPDVIRSFQKLANTGCVEFFAETYYNSLSWLYSKKEFQCQVEKHHELISELFGVTPAVFRNTELIYSNDLARHIAGMGYKGILCEGLDRILNGRTYNETYAAPGNGDFGLLLRNVCLSDDIAFRFDDPCWSEQPLTAGKFAGWLHQQKENVCNTSLFFDYETFGIYKKEDSGIFSFLEHLPGEILKEDSWSFVTPSEALEICYPKDIYDVPEIISWEDKGKECCVWSENTMQNNTLRKIYSIEAMVNQSGSAELLECWRKLQSADHFYYMCDNGRLANDAYGLLNPFENASEAFENYKNTITDFEIRLIRKGLADIRSVYKTENTATLYSSIY